jgi:hypothetical protein
MRLYALSEVPSEPPARELDARALRAAMWLALLHSQRLQLQDVTHRLCHMVVEVDELLEVYDQDAHG